MDVKSKRVSISKLLMNEPGEEMLHSVTGAQSLTFDCPFSPTVPLLPEVEADPGTAYASHNFWPKTGVPCQ